MNQFTIKKVLQEILRRQPGVNSGYIQSITEGIINDLRDCNLEIQEMQIEDRRQTVE